MISIKNLTIQYEDKDILTNGSIEFNNGDVVLIEGKNGTGKSSFLKTLVGLERKDKSVFGEVLIDDSKNILNMNDEELLLFRSQIAYLEQKDYYDSFYIDTVYDVLADAYSDYLGRKLMPEDKKFIEETFNTYVGAEVKIKLKDKVRKLSGGQQRIVSIIASICLRKDAKLFIIDEPLNNLDMSNIVQVSNLLNSIVKNSQDAIFLIVSHCKIFPFISKVVELVNKEFVIHNKKICNTCFGEPNEEGYYIEY